jgi:4a-hydroxytetrahydrobiopterin dehydratase
MSTLPLAEPALPDSQVLSALAAVAEPGLPAWTFTGDALMFHVELADFSAAWALLSEVALLAERQGHHPDWRNCWSHIDIRLTTHDAGNRVSQRDIEFVRAFQPILRRHLAAGGPRG